MTQKILTTISILFLMACKAPVTEVVKETHPNNQPKLVEYVQQIEGKEEVIEEKIFFDNGQLKMGGKFENKKRHGIWVAYFKNGNLQSEGKFKKGTRTGIAKVYYPNGQIRYQGQYMDNKEVGDWKFYSEKGELVKEKNFDN